MSILNSVIKLFVGDKQQKDLKILQPIVQKVQAFEASLAGLSNDELRNKTVEFKQKINDATKTFLDQIEELEQEALEAEIDRQEEIFTEIDKLKDEAYEASEAVLEEIMPEAFAVVKETAKRFVENEEILNFKAISFSNLSGIYQKDSLYNQAKESLKRSKVI